MMLDKEEADILLSLDWLIYIYYRELPDGCYAGFAAQRTTPEFPRRRRRCDKNSLMRTPKVPEDLKPEDLE